MSDFEEDYDAQLKAVKFGRIEKFLKPRKINTRYPRWVPSYVILSLTSFYASLGEVMYGFDQGILAGLLVNPVFVERFYKDHILENGEVDPKITGISVACLQACCFVTVLTCFKLVDVIGRRNCVRVGGLIYFTAAFAQMFANDLAGFVGGRTMQGVGVGILSITVPVIQAEISNIRSRGKMVGIQMTFNIIGYAISCWVDYGFYFHLPSNISWQGPYIVQACLAGLMLILSFLVPETPRWLAANGFADETKQTLANLHSGGNLNDGKVITMYTEIREAVLYERHLGTAGWGELFTKYRRRTFMGCCTQAFNQLNGINIVSFYLASTLSQAGFSTEKSLLYTVANSIVYIFATIPNWWLLDRWGRKPIMVMGSIMMMITLSMVCLFTELPSLDIMTRARGLFAFVVLYNAAFGASWLTVAYLIPAEVMPLRARAKGMAVAASCNWGLNFAIGMSTPSGFATMHGYYYLMIVGFNLISILLVKFFYIETAKHSLEEIAVLFGDQAFEHTNVIDMTAIADQKNKDIEITHNEYN
ncbi:hypothetical protein TRICI_000286 [Trichomonascus ciferrii]|uniref:Major facilitator superfamily (MFS) profile domain-containing protein n=1 Tax=Trichomonascus ciferrii TaxID=44093 RepID=A0A642VDZ6_9ASCO|nr:hypothetical protein TRICI_000286 [Trichomonascus ciferrii]